MHLVLLFIYCNNVHYQQSITYTKYATLVHDVLGGGSQFPPEQCTFAIDGAVFQAVKQKSACWEKSYNVVSINAHVYSLNNTSGNACYPQ